MSYMKDYVIFLGEEVSKKYPDKSWDECMDIVTDGNSFERLVGQIAKYHKLYLEQRRCAHA